MLQQVQPIAKAKRINRYADPADCSLLLSERAGDIARWMIERGNQRFRNGLSRGPFMSRYLEICELARRAYPLPASTWPSWKTTSTREGKPNTMSQFSWMRKP